MLYGTPGVCSTSDAKGGDHKEAGSSPIEESRLKQQYIEARQGLYEVQCTYPCVRSTVS